MSTVSLLRKTDDADPAQGNPEPTAFDLLRIERAVRGDFVRRRRRYTSRRASRHATPSRAAYAELLGGLDEDPACHLERVFAHRTDSDNLVLVRDIEFSSVCEHHLLPFNGTVQAAYLPAKSRVVGCSKIARTVDAFARPGPQTDALRHRTYEFEPDDDATIIRDRVRYRLPFVCSGT